MRIAIIGGGASGLLASIYAKTKENEVMVFERNAQDGKKLTLTGNGHCNYWNEDQNLSHYHSLEQVNLKEFLKEEDFQEVFSFFQKLGIVPYLKNGCYYPRSKNAQIMRELLVKEAQRRNVCFQNNFLVEEIVKQQDTFVINPKKEALLFDRVILACGGKSYPKTGSDGLGYLLAKSLGHHLTPCFPSLVSVVTKENLKDLKGIRVEASVSIWKEEQLIKQEVGEVLFTDYGVSGIVLFNLSRYASLGLFQKKQMHLQFNFLYFLEEDAHSWFQKQTQTCFLKSLAEILDGFLPYQLGNRILKDAKISGEKTWDELSFQEQQRLISFLTNYPLMITDTLSMETAQVTMGGVSLKEVQSHTFESKIVPGLFFAGEMLDVDGDCGGYNLSFAWISGMNAGKNAKKE